MKIFYSFFVLILFSGCSVFKTQSLDGTFGALIQQEDKSLAELLNGNGTIAGNLDMVIVMDNSGSMDENQSALAANLTAFGSEILDQINVCLAVTTTSAYIEDRYARSVGKKICRNPLDPNAMTNEEFLGRFQRMVLVCQDDGDPECEGTGSERVSHSYYQWLYKTLGFDAFNNIYDPTYANSQSFLMRDNTTFYTAIFTDEPFQIPSASVAHIPFGQTTSDGQMPTSFFEPESMYSMMTHYLAARNPTHPNPASLAYVTSIYDYSQEAPPYPNGIPGDNQAVLGGFTRLKNAVPAGHYSEFDIVHDDFSDVVDGLIDTIQNGVNFFYVFTTEHPAQEGSVYMQIVDQNGSVIVPNIPSQYYTVNYAPDATTVSLSVTYLSSLNPQPTWILKLAYQPTNFN